MSAINLRSLVFLALALTPLLRAQTSIDYQVVPGNGSTNNGGAQIGESFMTDEAAAFVTSLDIYVNNKGLATEDFTLSLYAVSGTAGSYIADGSALFSNTYSNAILGNTIGTHTLFDNLNWAVDGSTPYMVVFESSSDPTIKWQTALTSLNPSSIISGTSGQNRYGSIGGAIPAGAYYAMTVTTSAIPEPATYAALAGAVSLSFVAWRRRRS